MDGMNLRTKRSRHLRDWQSNSPACSKKEQNTGWSTASYKPDSKETRNCRIRLCLLRRHRHANKRHTTPALFLHTTTARYDRSYLQESRYIFEKFKQRKERTVQRTYCIGFIAIRADTFFLWSIRPMGLQSAEILVFLQKQRPIAMHPGLIHHCGWLVSTEC